MGEDSVGEVPHDVGVSHPLNMSSSGRRGLGVTVATSTDAAIHPLWWVGRVGVVVLVGVVLVIEVLGGFGFLAAVPYAFVGAFLAIRRPRNSIGWLLLATAFAFAFAFFALPATTAQLEAGTVPPLVTAVALVQAWASGVLLPLFLAVAILFPSGRLPTGRWRGAARLALSLVAVVTVLVAFAPTISVGPVDSLVNVTIPNPLAALPSSPLWSVFVVALPVEFVLLAGGVVSLFVRLRQARGVERAQFRWLVWGMALILVGLIVGLVGDVVSYGGFGGAVWIPAEIGFILPPIAIGIAVLRYRLYEIDRLVSRTIAYGVLTAIVGSLFIGFVLVFQAVLAPVTGSNELAVAGSTLLVFALFQPLRRRVQRLVDRRFNRDRYDAEATVAAFASRLRDVVDLEQLGAEISATVVQTVAPATFSLWLRE